MLPVTAQFDGDRSADGGRVYCCGESEFSDVNVRGWHGSV
jgi:hypothetical protein